MLDLKLASPQKHESLTLYPLIVEAKLKLPYTLLGDALEAETLEVTEVGEGSVPELTVHNKGETDVLILDGEQLIGARQNRMTNRSIVLGAKSKTGVPVSCMEQGRWHFESRKFSHGRHYSPSKVRRHARKHEAMYAAQEMAPDHRVLADAQGEVWSEIHSYSDALDASSPTGKLDHIYDAKARDLDTWLKAFGWVDDQVGVLAFIGDEVLGLDVIGCHKMYASLHKRLVSGYVMDALAARRRGRAREPGGDAAEEFLEKVRAAVRTQAPTVGKGTYRVLTESVMGGELEESGKLVHVSAFPAEDEGDRDEPERAPIRSPRQRRRRYMH